MLKHRVITAIVLLLVFTLSLLLPSKWPFALLSLLFVALAVWEWARLQHFPQPLAWATAATWGGACLLMLAMLSFHPISVWPTQVSSALWLLVSVAWTALLAVVLFQAPTGWARWTRAARLWVGLAALSAAWWAVVQLNERGLDVLFGALLTIWLSDIGAFFGGRRFGRRKLARHISPGKSWEGVWAGAVCAGVFAVVSAAWGFGLYGVVSYELGWLGVGLLSAGLVALGVAGDLFESVLKRSAGVKDSSGLLPGHGGVLDRLDALLPAMPFAMFVLALGEVL
jgi:phosphatidate cytidylyltransferase